MIHTGKHGCRISQTIMSHLRSSSRQQLCGFKSVTNII
jgi:hypothetical protein